MNPSQYVPPGPNTNHTPFPYPQAYAISPYPAGPGFARTVSCPSPAFTNMPGAAASAGLFSIPDRPSSQQRQQQQQYSQLAAAPNLWQQAFSPVPGQVEDVVSFGGPMPSQAPVDARPSSCLSMPQVQDVFALPGRPPNGSHGSHGFAVATTMPMPGFMSPPQGMWMAGPGPYGFGDGSYAIPTGLGLPPTRAMTAPPRGLDGTMFMRSPLRMDSAFAISNYPSPVPFPSNAPGLAMSPPPPPPPPRNTGYPPLMSP